MIAAAAGCASRNDGNACDGWQPLIVSEFTWAVMTDDEKRAVTAHNEFGERNCGWRPVE